MSVTTTYRPTTGPDRSSGSVRGRAKTRWARLRLPLVVGILLVATVAFSAMVRPRTSTVALAPDNAEPGGGRALAQILERQGVDVRYVRTMREALRADAPGTTLLVTSTSLLTDEQVTALASGAADLVLAGPSYWAVTQLVPGLDVSTSSATETRAAGCGDVDALAAGTIAAFGNELRSEGSGAGICFPGASEGSGLYAVADGGRRITLFADAAPFTNAALADEGHAALTLRALGRHPKLTWYAPTAGDTSIAGRSDSLDAAATVPAWFGPVGAQLAVLVVALAWWRSRRLGRLVTEPLPVTVRAAEATRGRGRLYRRSGSRGHAAAALRAGTASRMAARLGLPRSAGAVEVIDSVARAAGRSTDDVAGLVYGPPPPDDADLLRLAQQLDKLESEVRRS